MDIVTNDIAAHLDSALVGVCSLERLTALGCGIDGDRRDIGME